MEEDVDAGLLTAKTHWRDYCVKVLSRKNLGRITNEMTVPPLYLFIFSYLEGEGFTVLPGSSIKYIRFNTKRPL